MKLPSVTMELREYAALAIAKIERAGADGNRAEAARLLRLLGAVCIERAQKLDDTPPDEEQR